MGRRKEETKRSKKKNPKANLFLTPAHLISSSSFFFSFFRSPAFREQLLPLSLAPPLYAPERQRERLRETAAFLRFQRPSPPGRGNFFFFRRSCRSRRSTFSSTFSSSLALALVSDARAHRHRGRVSFSGGWRDTFFFFFSFIFASCSSSSGNSAEKGESEKKEKRCLFAESFFVVRL